MSNDREEVYEQANNGLLEQFDLVFLQPMQFNNTYALAVSRSLFQKNIIWKQISDLRGIEEEVKAGFTLEFYRS